MCKTMHMHMVTPHTNIKMEEELFAITQSRGLTDLRVFCFVFFSLVGWFYLRQGVSNPG